MSDAFHLLSDVASFIVALAAIYLAEKPPTKSKRSGIRDENHQTINPFPL